jgi:hypothetical protein
MRWLAWLLYVCCAGVLACGFWWLYLVVQNKQAEKRHERDQEWPNARRMK